MVYLIVKMLSVIKLSLIYTQELLFKSKQIQLNIESDIKKRCKTHKKRTPHTRHLYFSLGSFSTTLAMVA